MYGTDKYSQQLNHLASLAKWLSVRLRTKWLWVRIPLLSQRKSKTNIENHYYKRKNMLNYLIKPAGEVENVCQYQYYVYLEKEHEILLFGMLRNFLNSKTYRKLKKQMF